MRREFRIPNTHEELQQLDDYFTLPFKHLNNPKQKVTVIGAFKDTYLDKSCFSSDPGRIDVVIKDFYSEAGVKMKSSDFERPYNFYYVPKDKTPSIFWVPNPNLYSQNTVDAAAKRELIKILMKESVSLDAEYKVHIDALVCVSKNSKSISLRELLMESDGKFKSPEELYLERRKDLVYNQISNVVGCGRHGIRLVDLRLLRKKFFMPRLKGKYVDDKRKFFVEWIFNQNVTNNQLDTVGTVHDLEELFKINALSLLTMKK